MDISFNCDKMANAIKNLDPEQVPFKELARKIGETFIDCMNQGHTFFSGSLDLNATEYMLQQIQDFTAVNGTADTEEDKPRRKPGRKPGRKPKTVEPEKSAWTTEGKSHEQMLREKMAMHNGFEIPGAPKKRRGRKPKANA